MGEPPPRTPGGAAQDVEHLRLLSVFHYVVAALQAAISSVPVIHLLIGMAVVSSPEILGEMREDEFPAPVIGWMLILLALVWMIAGWSLAIGLVVAGRSLAARRRYLFCLVVAGLTAVMCIPFGTVLGVLTIVVLVRPSVKALFVDAGRPNHG